MAQTITVEWQRTPVLLMRDSKRDRRSPMQLRNEHDWEDKIPNSVGVYLFAKRYYNKEQREYVPLYIGCAKNIRSRMENYLKNPGDRDKSLMERISKDKSLGKTSEAILVIGELVGKDGHRIRGNSHEIAEKALIRKVIEGTKFATKLLNKQHTKDLLDEFHSVKLTGNSAARNLFGGRLLSPVENKNANN